MKRFFIASINPPIRGSIVFFWKLDSGEIGINPPIRGSIAARKTDKMTEEIVSIPL